MTATSTNSNWKFWIHLVANNHLEAALFINDNIPESANGRIFEAFKLKQGGMMLLLSADEDISLNLADWLRRDTDHALKYRGNTREEKKQLRQGKILSFERVIVR